jgi:hypothetical protein
MRSSPVDNSSESDSSSADNSSADNDMLNIFHNVEFNIDHEELDTSSSVNKLIGSDISDEENIVHFEFQKNSKHMKNGVSVEVERPKMTQINLQWTINL